MIADKSTSTIEVTSTLSGTAHAMGIDPAAMAHIMNVLTDLYSDPEYAVLREYSTNGRDAMIEALELLNAALKLATEGTPRHAEIKAAIKNAERPLDVTLPNALSPFLKIRDYGVGLSEQDIADIYSRYGASTKRGTNTQVGMLGLGCKSALTYVSQFTITSVKDGERVQVAVSREAEGGSMTVVDKRKTDEPTGTEIMIPVKRGHQFEAKAAKFFSYWPEGSVLVGGEPPKRIEGMWLNDKFCVTGQKTRAYYGSKREHVIVMGNVPYPVTEDKWNSLDLAYGYSVTAFVDIGAVDFVPSREALNYSSSRTAQAVSDLQDEFRKLVPGAIQRGIDKATTNAEAVKAMCDWHDIFQTEAPAGGYKYKGRKLPLYWRIVQSEGTVDKATGKTVGRVATSGYHDPPSLRIAVVPKQSHVQNRHDTPAEVRADLWAGALWVHGYDGKKFSAPQKQKLLKFIQDRTDVAEIARFILTDPVPAGIKDWIDPSRIVAWEDVNKVKLDRSNVYGGYKVIPGSYDNVTVNGSPQSEVEAKNIDATKPIFYYDGHWYHMRDYAALIAQSYPSHTVVPLPANRKEKFLRNFPTAKNIVTECENLSKAWAAQLPSDVRKALAISDKGLTDSFRKLDPAKVSDRKIKQAIKFAKIDLTATQKSRKLFQKVLGNVDGVSDAWTNPLVHYPLFDECQLRTKQGAEHTYLYLNAAHKAQA